MRKIFGIYQIKNLVNGKIYIGSSVNIARRWREHKTELRKDRHGNIYLQRSWNKYGEEEFEFSVLLLLNKKDNLIIKEQEYLDTLCPEYNLAYKAGASMKGKRHTNETKKKMSNSSKGDKNGFFGKRHTKESIKKISKAGEGRIFSLEAREKLSKLHRGENHYHTTLTNDSVVKIRDLWKIGKYTQVEIGKMFGVNNKIINNIINYRTWKHVY